MRIAQKKSYRIIRIPLSLLHSPKLRVGHSISQYSLNTECHIRRLKVYFKLNQFINHVFNFQMGEKETPDGTKGVREPSLIITNRETKSHLSFRVMLIRNKTSRCEKENDCVDAQNKRIMRTLQSPNKVCCTTRET